MINRVLEKLLGVRLTRTFESRKKELVKKLSQANENTVYIEFIGPSGVGKSTYFNHLKLHKKHEWISKEELTDLYRERFPINKIDSNENYRKLSKSKIDLLQKRNLSPVLYMRYIEHHLSVLIDDSIIKENNKDQIIVSEEGLIQGYHDAFLKLENSNENFNSQELLKNRAYVYFYAPPEIIIKHIEDRKKKLGIIMNAHKDKTYNELIELQNQRMEKFETLLSIFKNYNIPFLNIDTSKDFNENIELINQFIIDLGGNS